jgi:hypothetical protein
MKDSPYNKLPDDIKRKFEVVYSELLFDNLTLFKNQDEKWGVLTKIEKFGFLSYNYLIRPIYNSISFNKDLKLIEAVKYENNVWSQDKNTFLYFDVNGNIVWQSNQCESVRIDKFGNIILGKENKYGLLDKDFNQRIKPKYERISALNYNFFKVFQDNRYGIVNRDDSKILDFEFDEVLNIVEKNKVIVRKKELYYSFDLEKYLFNELPFSKILNASSNTYAAPSPESFRYYKSIINSTENTDYDEYDLEMVRYQGKWGIIDGAGEEIILNNYCFVDFLRNPKYFKVGIGEIEVVESEDEERIFRTSIKNVKWGIVNINNEIVVPIEYDWIDEVESTVWVVFKGGTVYYNDDYQENYWTIKNGKLGVYNLDKLITPIEYDAIKKNWFRIKEYIFVQKENTKYFDDNSTDYDVFTLQGNKIEVNKPNPKDYTYYNNLEINMG